MIAVHKEIAIKEHIPLFPRYCMPYHLRVPWVAISIVIPIRFYSDVLVYLKIRSCLLWCPFMKNIPARSKNGTLRTASSLHQRCSIPDSKVTTRRQIVLCEGGSCQGNPDYHVIHEVHTDRPVRHMPICELEAPEQQRWSVQVPTPLSCHSARHITWVIGIITFLSRLPCLRGLLKAHHDDQPSKADGACRRRRPKTAVNTMVTMGMG
jgi:hypothetical protein